MATEVGDWTFDVERGRYRYASGRLVPDSRVTAYLESFISKEATRAGDLMRLLANRTISLSAWEQEMRAILRRTHIASAVVGRGGRSQMTFAEYGRIGADLKKQYRFLREFAEQVGRGELTEGQIAARSELYAESGRRSYWRGIEARHSGLVLPCHPGDGGTDCLVRCKCHWSIEETDTEWRASWIVSSGKNGPCPGCVRRASTYGPYVQTKG